ncbi:hypothetical protein E2C01_060501 [Portunus trituberculatus]|uniref:Uncharacterized protein n=1 Tax=Portunus trituberculatus TaxID=210409 RepID=A0A5B7H889_PORTR|nr:hypothetical protein [Portunus trituberculatus]
MTCFHIHSGDYLVILYSFRNSLPVSIFILLTIW